MILSHFPGIFSVACKNLTRPGGRQPASTCQVKTTGVATEAPTASASTEPRAPCVARVRWRLEEVAGAVESDGAGACAELRGTLQ